MYLSRVKLKPDIGRNSQLGKLLENSSYHTHQLLWDLFDQKKRDFLYREEIAKEQLPNHVGVKGEPLYYLLSPEPPKTDTPLFCVETKEYKPIFEAGQKLAFRLRVNPVITRGKKRHDLVMDEQVVLFQRICTETSLPVSDKKSELKAILLQRDNIVPVQEWMKSYLGNTRFFAEVNRRHSMKQLLNLVVQEAVSRRLATWLVDSESRAGVFALCEQEVEDEFTEQSMMVPNFQWYGYRTHAIREKNPRLSEKTAGVSRFLTVEITGELIVKEPVRFLGIIQKGIGPAKAFGCGLMLVRRV